MQKVAFYTLGCKVNQYDTQSMLELFKQAGYEIVPFNSLADVYVINTCTVTNLSDRKSRQMIRRARKRNPKAIIAVVGCYAQRAPEEILSIEGVSLVIGTRDRHKIVRLVENFKQTGEPLNWVRDIMEQEDFEELPIRAYEGRTRAFIKLQDGCNQYCSYCIIPYARGNVRSRAREDIISEVNRLANLGFKEVVLTGIHIASYGLDLENVTLLDIIKDIHGVDGIKRIRLSSLEPTLLTDDFISSIKQLPKVCRHFHISLQSGCDNTLKRMNRKYNTHLYRRIVNNLRQAIPQVSITTDVMVGFPGETEQDFIDSYNFIREIGFSKLHVFKYSPREGTPAAGFKDQVSNAEKERRSLHLIKLGRLMERNYIMGFLDQKAEVLFEQPVDTMPGYLEGYTDTYIKVVCNIGEEYIGQLVEVLLEDIKGDYVLGRPII
ncbi:MAG TPA: tRNA (N(6)-L-threonylcarbamoyladenosine(37)-C(2))-methylthiotransferase MtaB [Clostridiales bacterium]|nr:tRNA (N(6)-L-threonylcarbamoyladenosine(37)-C(2))-methylthiotransferase MtaB [Clostridiales bacterium]